MYVANKFSQYMECVMISKTNKLLILALGLTLLSTGCDKPEEGSVAVKDLRCEYLTNPLGIDVLKPRLSWIIESNQRGQKQTAYQIVVAESKEKLKVRQSNLWDTGKINSDQSIHVVYEGEPLKSQMQCYWKIRVWDKNDKSSPWSEPAMWTMGLLKPEDWNAKWIGLDTNEPQLEERRLPARMLRKEFNVRMKVKRATAYVCGLGFFELYLNNSKVGNHIMDPGLTDYTKRALYVTFDITDQLQEGTNAVGVILGNGRFFAPREKVPAPTQTFGYPKLLLQMIIEYEDGTTSDIVSDEKWKITTEGPIRANNEYDGEEYDARMEQHGWANIGFDDSTWQNVQSVEAPGGMLYSQMIEPMRITQVIKPVAITNPRPGMYLIDMGQAFYGTVRLKDVSGPEGTEIQMCSAYSLDTDGTLRARDNRSARSTDIYILKGHGKKETWHPRFRGHGYRFIEVTGFPGIPTTDNFEGLVIHTDLESTGQFSCSNTLINQIHNNILWTMRAFKRSAPLDPDRDEKQSWMGDTAKDPESDAYNFNVVSFYNKWLADIRLAQRNDGSIPDISMYWDWGKNITWPSVITILPEWYYNFYADKSVLEENYETMKNWMQFVEHYHHKPDFTVDVNGYGDWCDASTIDQGGKKGFTVAESLVTSPQLISSAYNYNNCKIMARSACLLGKAQEHIYFADLAEKIKIGFNNRFFNPQTNQYSVKFRFKGKQYQGESQCSNLLPLTFGLVPEENREAVIANFINDIMETHNGHTSVGLIGMQWLMQTLTDIGHPEVAYTIVTQTTRPSWGYMISKGATTIWERWDTDTQPSGMNSETLLILAGNLDAWFYQTLAGINYDPESPGFKHIILKPHLLGNLNFVNAQHKSMYGTTISNWSIEGDTFHWKLTIPANTTATVYIPAESPDAVTESGKSIQDTYSFVKFIKMQAGRAVYQIGSGSYTFESTKLSEPVATDMLNRTTPDPRIRQSPNFNLNRNILIRSITPHGVSDSLNICEVYC